MSSKSSQERTATEASVEQDGLTVLDWFKSLMRGAPLSIPEAEQVEPEEPAPEPEPEAAPGADEERPAPWREGWLSPERLRFPVALVLALGAQLGLARRVGLIELNAAAYLVAAVLAGWAVWAGDLALPQGIQREREVMGVKVRPQPLALGMVFGLLVFLSAGGNQFRSVTIISWLLAFYFTFVGLWEGELPWNDWLARARAWVDQPSLHVRLNSWHLLLLLALAVVAFFRYSALATVPYEMWSDQAEKLLDVRDVLDGQYRIFFPRNAGREAMVFYSAAATIRLLGTGLSFITLKMVTATAGFLAVPFLYFLGKEVGGRETGLYAMLLAGVAFWPNIVARAGLRMPFNELAVAPAMFFLVRGLRSGQRNDFLWSGLAVGLGFYGYTGARVLPLAIVLGFLIYLLTVHDAAQRNRTLIALGGLVLVSVIGFLPLMRVLVDMPDQVLYRTLTRMGTTERGYPAPPLLQFLINMRDVLLMFSWDTGEVWIVTVLGRPGLDWVSGAFFHLGAVIMVVNFARRRRWEGLFLVLSVPILLLSSALALAFPNENPSPNRVSGAIVPVFTVAGYGMATGARWLRDRMDNRSRLLTAAPVVALLLVVGLVNHRLVFDTYAERQRMSAWNYSEAGAVMRGFADLLGDFEQVYIVAYPHWFDSRIPAIIAGAPIRQYGVFPDQLAEQELDPARYHLFLVKPEDQESIQTLRQQHPGGIFTRYVSEVQGRDFYVFLVPAIGEEPQP